MTNTIKGRDWRIACKQVRAKHTDEIAEITRTHGEDSAQRFIEQLAIKGM